MYQTGPSEVQVASASLSNVFYVGFIVNLRTQNSPAIISSPFCLTCSPDLLHYRSLF